MFFIMASSTFTAPQLKHCERGCCGFIDGREVTPEEFEKAEKESWAWASEVGPDRRAGGVNTIECRRATT
jgi:hypothetical protein